MAKLKILIADDEPDVLTIMAKRLKAEGYDVIAVNDGKAAWNKIVAEDPDIIILDLTMPKLDGFEVLKKLREAPPSKKWQPVIIVSAREELKDIREGFTLEADHYLTKPCDMEDVLKSIRLMTQLIPHHKTKDEA